MGNYTIWAHNLVWSIQDHIFTSKDFNPDISIILLTHNNEKTIEKCLCSLLQQTYKNFEIIILDNNSVDFTHDVIHVLSVDSRIKYFKCKENQMRFDIKEILCKVKSNRILVIDPKENIKNLNLEKLNNIDALKKLPDINYYSKGRITTQKKNNFSIFKKVFLPLFKQLLSISVFDSHYVIYILGIHIRSKIKLKPIENTVVEFGLNNTPRDIKIIASLTSFPQRVETTVECVKTLLKQTVKPDELILWLANEQFPNKEDDLPEALLKLKDFGLSIKWCEDLRSYKKLLPTLKEYPNDIIITFDDDIYYDNNIIENLYNSYQKDPHAISTNRAGRIKLDKKNFKLYKNSHLYWTRYKMPSFKNTIIGCGGVLYPPYCLHADILNIEKIRATIPTQDDIWFWAMAVLNNTPIKVVSSYDMNIRTIGRSQQYGLAKINATGSSGLSAKEALNIILKAYPQINDILSKDTSND